MKIVVLAGGVGGAKLVDGIAQVYNNRDLTVIVNIGDDFEHLGLHISPDLDTVCYTVRGIANPIKGWGRDDETWNVLPEVISLGGPDWFSVGDKDLALHLERTRRLRAGDKLSKITADFCKLWGVDIRIIPVSDDPIATIVNTEEFGPIGFQEYFVKYKCEPIVKNFHFAGLEHALPAEGIIEAIEKADFVIIAPSNPWVSIDPILNVVSVRDAIKRKTVCCVSPIIEGKALKGPAAKMFTEMGFESSARSVASHYSDIIKIFVYHHTDATYEADFLRWGIISYTTDVVMRDRQDRVRLAAEILEYLERIKDKSL